MDRDIPKNLVVFFFCSQISDFFSANFSILSLGSPIKINKTAYRTFLFHIPPKLYICFCRKKPAHFDFSILSQGGPIKMNETVYRTVLSHLRTEIKKKKKKKNIAYFSIIIITFKRIPCLARMPV